jgi:hypothetical protein
LLNSLTLFVKQLNRQLEALYGKLILRSSITWIAFPFASGLLTGSRLGFYFFDTPLPFVVGFPAVAPLHFVANGVWVDDFVPF